MTRVAFATLGCRVNQADTQELRQRLEAAGCRAVPFEAPADVVVINTCTVTSRAELSGRQLIRRAARTHPNARIVVTGCWAQMAPEAVAALPGVGLVMGGRERDRIDDWVSAVSRVPLEVVADASADHSAASGRQPGASGHGDDPDSPLGIVDRPVEDATEGRSPAAAAVGTDKAVAVRQRAGRAAARTRAFLKIQDGCQHRCAFCIVPYARGASRSRDPGHIADRVAELVEAGHPEVVLTGVDMGHYGADLVPRTTLARLLRDLAGVPGLRWLRLSSLLPAYLTAELVEAVTTIPVIAPHFHIPLQSGSDRVLRRMRRPYTAALYRRVVESLAKAMPALGLGTDVIAGFPGELEEDFAQTLDLVTALPFSYLHVFPYSVRQGTEASGLSGRLPAQVTAARSQQLRRLGDLKNLAFRRRLMGGIEEVLVLATRDRETGRLVGLTGNYVEVAFRGADALVGRLARVRVTEVHGQRTEGEWNA
jgi:threonylcarbamoyladenosine tRNA methylthiotransferase MtaB